MDDGFNWYLPPPPNAKPAANQNLSADSLQQAYVDLVRTPRTADEPLVTQAVADYLADWFSKEPAQQ